jgi:hypothetical protein
MYFYRLKASYLQVANWVDAAWRSLSEDTITKSFQCTGIIGDGKPDELHSRLKELLYPEEPVELMESESDSDLDGLLTDEGNKIIKMHNRNRYFL